MVLLPYLFGRSVDPRRAAPQAGTPLDPARQRPPRRGATQADDAPGRHPC